MKKLTFLLLLALFFSFSTSPIKAALLTVKADGKVISQVLGDSTIKIKSVTGNLATTNSQISLNNIGGKIQLNNMDVSNLNENLVEIEARGNTNDLKIKASGTNFTIEEGNITAITQFPITIDPAKNELSVSTDTGSRLVSVLPYEATLVLTRGKEIDKVTSNQINLNENAGGELEYTINGTKNLNILNIASVSSEVSSTVSATTGEVIKINEPVWLKLFGFLFS